MELRYELQKSEYEDYYKCEIYKSPENKKLQHRAWTILPVILLVVLIYLRPHQVLWYIGAIVLSLLWILLVNWRVAARIKQGAAKKTEEMDKNMLHRITVKLYDSGVTVNGRTQTVKNYSLWSDLIIVFFDDDTVLLIPARVFEGNNDALRKALRIIQNLSALYIPPAGSDEKGRKRKNKKN